MADGFSVNYAFLDTATDEMQQETQKVQNALEDLSSQMQSVVNQLDGVTVESFSSAIAYWQSNVNDMNFLLAQARQALNQVRDNYNTTDLREGALWDALK
ncbi:hypothetical protein GCM10027570_29070 [Streptomonospora sediminis]